MAKKQHFERLISDFGKNMDINNPLPEYPRPQMVRDSYINLNGIWQYAILPTSQQLSKYQGDIVVPFSPECILSGVEHIVQPDETLYYKKTFDVPKDFIKDRVLLHFGAVDYLSDISINGNKVLTHRGGYFPFSIDITNYIQEKDNILTLSVTDPSDKGMQSRGKQKLKRGGIFYTPQSGIWQTVWLESVSNNYIQKIKITPNIDNATVHIKVVAGSYKESKITVYDNGEIVSTGKLKDHQCTLKIDNQKLWTPENPHLYDVTITVDNDTVNSYFGMRKYGIGKDENGIQRLMLNNKPYFHNGLLDQGYYSDGLYTPPSDDAMIFDIQTAKKMGFNMLRKHIKIAPLRWYYHCDRLGVLVWQDMINGGDGANNIWHGIKGFFDCSIDDSRYHKTGRQCADSRAEYYIDTERTIDTLYNCVSLCLWVPFNESWGQFDSLKVYEYVKALDATRPIDHASGWLDQGGGDFKSIHVYFRKVRLPKDTRPIILSEFGGYSVKVDGHVFNKRKSFGYRKYKDIASFEKAYHDLFNNTIIPLIKEGLSATVYTQITDVEDEINGLITYDRKIVKLDIDKLAKLNKKLVL